MKLELDISKMDALAKRFEEAGKKYRVEKRAMFERAGELLKKRLDENINSKLGDDGGTIKSWQEERVGSGGGYAAISPIKTPPGTKKGEAPGAITNYLEHGHKIRGPSGKAKRKRPRRINVLYVSGRYFYHDTAKQMETEAEKLANEFANEIAKELEG